MIWLFVAAHTITVDASRLPLLKVTLDYTADRICTNIIGGGRGIRGLTPTKDDPDCFLPKKTYDVDLRALENGNPDYAALYGGAWIFNDQAVFLRPEPLPDVFDVKVSINVPVVSVWPNLTADRDALDGGTYWGIGPFKMIAPNIARLPSRESDDAVRKWIGTAVKAVTSFHPMPDRTLIFVAGGPHMFGSVMRRHWVTAALLQDGDFDGDWMAVHELFHSVMPHVRKRPAWLIEGFTTYYQDVLRARTGMRTSQQMWDDLHDAIQRYGQPVGGRSLEQESIELRKTHAYQRVYWGGAVLALQLDVAMRQRGSSLDAVLKKAFTDSLGEALDADDMLSRLDAASDGLASKSLRQTKPIDYAPLYRSLGLSIVDDKHVTLRHDTTRQAIMP